MDQTFYSAIMWHIITFRGLKSGEVAKYRPPAPQAAIVDIISRGFAHRKAIWVHNIRVLAVI